jgi:hypothetical protein
MSKWKKVLVELQEPLKISMMIFTPAVLLVLGGFHFMSPTVLSQLIDLRKEEVNKAVVKEVTERIDTVVDKKLKGKDIEKIKSAGSVTQEELEAINKSIQTQVQEETKKATKDELENLAKTLKADLYKDLSLSVIFAIASIFAAFAVKDILTEILKKEEREQVITDITSNVKKSLEESIGMTRKDPSKNLSQELEYNLQQYAEITINNKIKDPIVRLDEGLKSIEVISTKVKEIEYEAADLTASQISGNLTNPIVLNTYLRPISIIQELIKIRPTDEVLKLCREYQLKSLQTRIENELPHGKSREELEQFTGYIEDNQSTEDLQEDLFNKSLRDAMNSILDIRMCQFNELLTNLLSKSSDPEQKKEIEEKIAAILDLNTPGARLLKRMNAQSSDANFNKANIDSRSNTFPGKVPRQSVSGGSLPSSKPPSI